MSLIEETIRSIEYVADDWRAMAEERQLSLTKPPGSLGRLEAIANRLCAIQRSLQPKALPHSIIVFAADHGVAAEGVSAYPQEVTAQMVANFCAGGAAINALSRQAGSRLLVVDIGVAGTEQSESRTGTQETTGPPRLLKRRVRRGTRNISVGPAMTESEMLDAVGVGVALANEASRAGVRLVGLGEMGIGNTTSASAITAALTGLAPGSVTGRGTGATDPVLARKVKVVEQALAANAPCEGEALDILRKVGGLEIAGLCGLCLGAARWRISIVMDGFITTAAAALAVLLCPAVAGYIFAAHLSPEPGHKALLELIGAEPLLDLGMRLGEGTGAALGMNLIASAVAAFTEMATFASAGISQVYR